MNKYRDSLLVLLIVTITAAMGFVAVAASSGCYRWHSCPSTTGLYVCGDTGHCSACPDNRYCAGGAVRTSAVPATAPDTSGVDDSAASQPATIVALEPFIPAKPSKSAGCKAQGGLPDSACTPGAVLNVTAAQICKSGYSKSVRSVTTRTKTQVYKEYGIVKHLAGQYEVDHFISLELGGSNDVANLWPEAANPNPGFREKDKVENWLHHQVCSDAMTLNEAQREIATSWTAAFATMDAQTQKIRVSCVGGCP